MEIVVVVCPEENRFLIIEWNGASCLAGGRCETFLKNQLLDLKEFNNYCNLLKGVVFGQFQAFLDITDF